jgi:hypothetical protein
MTAINIIVLEKCSHLITDGAAIDQHGNLICTMAKVLPLPHLNCAAAFRGSPAMQAVFFAGTQASGISSYDGLRSGLAEVLRKHLEPLRMPIEQQYGVGALAADLFIVGAGCAFILATHDGNAPGVPAWQPVDIGGVFFAPSNSALATEFARIQLEYSDEKAVELVTRQRGIGAPLVTNPEQPGPCSVGGFVQRTTVFADRIETKALKLWPDKIGSPMIPERERN